MIGEEARKLLYFLGTTSLEESIAKDDEQAAHDLNKRVRAYGVLAAQYRLAFAELGVIAIEYEKRELWRYETNEHTGESLTGFDDWASHCPEACRSSIYAAKSLATNVLPNMSAETFIKIPKENAYTMSKCSSQTQRKESVQQAAIEMNDESFHAHLAKTEPQECIEIVKVKRFKLESSQSDVVEAALKKAGEQGETKDQSEQLTCICMEYLSGDRVADLISKLRTDNGATVPQLVN
jgi:hypothetical protein